MYLWPYLLFFCQLGSGERMPTVSLTLHRVPNPFPAVQRSLLWMGRIRIIALSFSACHRGGEQWHANHFWRASRKWGISTTSFPCSVPIRMKRSLLLFQAHCDIKQEKSCTSFTLLSGDGTDNHKADKFGFYLAINSAYPHPAAKKILQRLVAQGNWTLITNHFHSMQWFSDFCSLCPYWKGKESREWKPFN